MKATANGWNEKEQRFESNADAQAFLANLVRQQKRKQETLTSEGRKPLPII